MGCAGSVPEIRGTVHSNGTHAIFEFPGAPDNTTVSIELYAVDDEVGRGVQCRVRSGRCHSDLSWIKEGGRYGAMAVGAYGPDGRALDVLLEGEFTFTPPPDMNAYTQPGTPLSAYNNFFVENWSYIDGYWWHDCQSGGEEYQSCLNEGRTDCEELCPERREEPPEGWKMVAVEYGYGVPLSRVKEAGLECSRTRGSLCLVVATAGNAGIELTKRSASLAEVLVNVALLAQTKYRPVLVDEWGKEYVPDYRVRLGHVRNESGYPPLIFTIPEYREPRFLDIIRTDRALGVLKKSWRVARVELG